MSFASIAPLLSAFRSLRIRLRPREGREPLALIGVALAALLLNGCREPHLGTPPGAEEPQAPAAASPASTAHGSNATGASASTPAGPPERLGASRGAVAPDPAGVERPEVTPERIDAFLAYQRRRLELEKALWADLAAEAMTQTPSRARSRKPAPEATAAPTAASLRRLEQRAEEDAEALESAGLSPAELVAVDALVREVLGPRQLVRELALEETVTLLEEQAERLEGAQREELLAQVGPLKERMTSLNALADVRAAHGDAAVDAVLSREEALLAWQEARLTTLLEQSGREEGEGQAGGR